MESIMLSGLIFLPVLFAAVILLAGLCEKKSFSLGVISTGISLFLSVWMSQDFFLEEAPEYLFQEVRPWWLEGISYRLGMDRLAASLVILTAFIFPLCLLSIKTAKKVPLFTALLLVLQATIFGVFLTQDLVLFYVFFEASLIPMYLMIGIWGGKGRIAAGFKFFLYTLAGSLLLLVAMIYMYQQVGSTDFASLLAYDFTLTEQKWLFLAFFVAFAVKIPMVPFHTWLPVAHVEAPTAGSAILAAILLKMGGYGFLRLAIPFFPQAAAYYADFIQILSLIAIIYASIVAFTQQDVKRLIAYSSVAHMGYVTLALFTFREDGLQAAMFQMISHGFVSAGLFFCIGVIYDRYHTRDIHFYGGLAKVMPAYAVVFMVFTMANIGLPATSGFIGEFLTIMAVVQQNVLYAFIVGVAVILSAGYGLLLYRKTMFGDFGQAEFVDAQDLTGREILIFAPLVVATIYLGVSTKELTDFLAPSLEVILSTAKG